MIDTAEVAKLTPHASGRLFGARLEFHVEQYGRRG